VTNCSACGSELPERGSYCPSCGTQTRCKTCRAVLEPNAAHCVDCGSPLGVSGAVEVDNGNAVLGPAANQLTYDEEVTETGSRRTFRVSATDEAIGNLTGTVELLLHGQPLGRDSGHVRTGQIIEGKALPPGAPVGERVKETAKEPVHDGEDVSAVTTSSGENTSSDAERLRNVFSYEGEQLRLIEPRLKAGSHLDAARRLSYLVLYAHELEGRTRVPRSEVNDVLKDASLFDSNSSKWLSQSPDLASGSDSVGLKVPGREKARKILNEILDPDVPNEWALGTGRQRRGAKANVESSQNGTTKGSARARRGAFSGRSRKVDEWVAAWNAKGPPLDSHAVNLALQSRPLAEKGIFGLWAIRRAVGDDGKVVSRLHLARFLYEVFEIKVSDRNLGKALEGNAAKGRVIKVQGTQYQIQTPGMKDAEAIAAGLASGAAASGG
jgi:predicted RNA-binding Zn-ribbon protein involved in translation (DUF1610 family)